MLDVQLATEAEQMLQVAIAVFGCGNVNFFYPIKLLQQRQIIGVAHHFQTVNFAAAPSGVAIKKSDWTSIRSEVGEYPAQEQLAFGVGAVNHEVLSRPDVCGGALWLERDSQKPRAADKTDAQDRIENENRRRELHLAERINRDASERRSEQDRFHDHQQIFLAGIAPNWLVDAKKNESDHLPEKQNRQNREGLAPQHGAEV